MFQCSDVFITVDTVRRKITGVGDTSILLIFMSAWVQLIEQNWLDYNLNSTFRKKEI